MSIPVIVCAPFAGIVSYSVESGAAVRAGQTVGQVEAVKISAPVVSPAHGTFTPVVEEYTHVDGGDELATIAPVTE